MDTKSSDRPTSAEQTGSPTGGATYLLACWKDEVFDKGCVFYLASSRSLAESLHRMFTDTYADSKGWRFSTLDGASVKPEDRIRLYEAITRLDVYVDPDPSVYEPEPSAETILRAEFKRQAERWEEALMAQAGHAQSRESEPPPSDSTIADTALLAMILRDALHVQLDYPEIGTSLPHVALVKEIRARLDRALSGSEMAGFRELADVSNQLTEMPEPMRWGMFAALVATWHSKFSNGASGAMNEAEIPAATERAIRACQDTALPEVKGLAIRLGEVMLVSCRRPSGTDPSFKDPCRAAHVLDKYWRPASSLLHAQMKIHVGYSPHPLTRIIENLRDRIAWCFEILKDRPEAARVAEEADGLLSMLSEGDVDDLTAIEEWATPAIRGVELFVARATMSLGAWHGTMTQAETFFLSHIEPLVAEHTRDVSARWKRMLAKADALGVQHAAQRSSKQGSGPSSSSETDGNDPPPPPPPVQKGPRVVLGKRGEPCIVDGKQMPPLTDGRYAVIDALIKAGEDGLTKDALEAVRGSARRMLEDLSELHPEWAVVIQMAGTTNRRYRIRC